MADLKKQTAAFALAGAMLLTPAAQTAGQLFGEENTSFTLTASAAAPAAVSFKSSSATKNSITLKWTKSSGAKGYYLYQRINGKYKRIANLATTSYTVTGLTAGTEYIFKIKAYNGSQVSAASSAYRVSTASSADPTKIVSTIKSVTSNTNGTKVKVTWKKVNCSGYVLLIYDYVNEKWVKAAKLKGGDLTSYTFNTSVKAPGSNIAIGNRGVLGYQFAVRPYTLDSNGKSIAGKTTKMKDPYYNINAITSYFGSQYTLLQKVLAKNSTGKTRSSYTYYSTSAKEKNGKKVYTSKVYGTRTLTNEDRTILKNFADEHFKSSWSNAQKIAYTVNWVNKNVKYDTGLSHDTGSFTKNIFVNKWGQCNSYNGAICDLLTYLGYKNVYLQYMDPSARSPHHHVTHIMVGKTTYTIEAGNADSSGLGWITLCAKYDEVPLGTIK